MYKFYSFKQPPSWRLKKTSTIMKKILLTLSFLTVASIGFSQVIQQQPTVVAVLPVIKQATKKQTVAKDAIAIQPSTTRIKQTNPLPQEGTYQIIVNHEDLLVDLSPEILSEVKNKREAENITYLTVNEYVKIKILPYNLIQSEEFVPLKTYHYEN